VLGWPERFATTEPHSSTTFEVVGNVGVALLVLAGALVAAERWPRPLAPLAAVGAMALTAYDLLTDTAMLAQANQLPNTVLSLLK